MSLTIALKAVDVTRRSRIMRFAATPTGNYATGGDTVDFTTASNPNNEPHPIPDRIPEHSEVSFLNNMEGNQPKWVKGTTLANSKVKFYSSAETELAAGAYSANDKAQPIEFEVKQSLGKSQPPL